MRRRSAPALPPSDGPDFPTPEASVINGQRSLIPRWFWGWRAESLEGLLDLGSLGLPRFGCRG
jgi:hypothetical protein